MISINLCFINLWEEQFLTENGVICLMSINFCFSQYFSVKKNVQPKHYVEGSRRWKSFVKSRTRKGNGELNLVKALRIICLIGTIKKIEIVRLIGEKETLTETKRERGNLKN